MRDHIIGSNAFWRSSNFWLTAATVVLPFGWVLWVVKLEPVRVRVRYLRRRS